MSAEILRKAAALMRKRAEETIAGRWFANDEYEVVAEDGGWIVVPEVNVAEGEHIASWHPAVALAVADWLVAAYERWRFDELSLSAQSVRAMSGGTNEPDSLALAVARAYLGGDA